MSDGAHLGVSASRALDTILGGAEQPAESEQASPYEVRDRILAAAKRGGDPTDYGDCADMVAGFVLQFYNAHIDAVHWPAEQKGEWVDANGTPVDPRERLPEGAEFKRSGPDLYTEVKAFTDGKLEALGITGFQWGWAVNAARYAIDLAPEPNPAIVTVSA